MYDLFIIGSGPAGMTAAIYAARANMKVAIVEKATPGGTVTFTSVIENYPGFEKIDGAELASSMFMQMINKNVEFIGEEAIRVNKENNYFLITTDSNEYKSKTVVLATGTSFRKLQIPGEEKYSGKGISWCAICDGALYKDRVVAVIGGGNSAVKEAIYLSNLAKKVYVIHRRDEFRADSELVSKMKNNSKIELVLNVNVKEFKGDEKLGSICLVKNDNNQEFSLEIDGCFEYVGQNPNNQIAVELGIVNEKGYIEVDNNCETKINGLFACGDIIEKEVRQIVTAVSDGAIAAIKASKYIGE